MTAPNHRTPHPLVGHACCRRTDRADADAVVDAPARVHCFILVGCPLVGAGILFYLYSIASHHTS